MLRLEHGKYNLALSGNNDKPTDRPTNARTGSVIVTNPVSTHNSVICNSLCIICVFCRPFKIILSEWISPTVWLSYLINWIKRLWNVYYLILFPSLCLFSSLCLSFSLYLSIYLSIYRVSQKSCPLFFLQGSNGPKIDLLRRNFLLHLC